MVVHLPHHFGDSVVAPAPDEDVAVGVPGDDVAIGGESQTGDVLGFVPLVKDSRLPAQCERGLIQLPEVDEPLPHGDDSSALQGVELSSDHGLRGALGLRDLVAPLPPGPVPDGDVVLHLVHHTEQVASVSLAEGEAADGAVLKVLGAQNVKSLQRNRIPDPET